MCFSGHAENIGSMQKLKWKKNRAYLELTQMSKYVAFFYIPNLLFDFLVLNYSFIEDRTCMTNSYGQNLSPEVE